MTVFLHDFLLIRYLILIGAFVLLPLLFLYPFLSLGIVQPAIYVYAGR